VTRSGDDETRMPVAEALPSFESVFPFERFNRMQTERRCSGVTRTSS